MKHRIRKLTSLLLSLSLISALTLPAAASNALGGGPVRQGHTSPPGNTAFHQCILEYNLLRSPDGKSHHLHA